MTDWWYVPTWRGEKLNPDHIRSLQDQCHNAETFFTLAAVGALYNMTNGKPNDVTK